MRAADVVVVGGGIIGACTAYFLSRAGVDTVLVDRDDVAGGTSSRCDGNVLAIDKHPGYDCQITIGSQELLARLARELDRDFEYRAIGSTLAVESEADLALAADWVRGQQESGLPTRLLDWDEIHAQEPHLAPDVAGAIECDSDSTLNPMALVYGLVEGAKRQGARVMPYTAVTGIALDRMRVSNVETDAGVIPTRAVVNAAGAWAGSIGAMVGIDIPIKPRKGQILVAETGEPVCSRKMMEFGYLMAKFGTTRDVEPDMERYGVAMVFEPTASGNFLIGSSREFVGYDTKVSIRVARLQARRALRFFPRIGEINVIRTYAGVRPWTPDHRPIVSDVPGIDGYYIAAGHEGDGIGLGPVTGLLVADMICGREPSFPLAPLNYARFAASRPPGN